MLHHYFKISAAAAYHVFLCFTLSIIAVIIIPTKAATDESYATPYCPNSSSNYTANSSYQANLNQLISWLSSNSSTRENGYYNTTIGAGSDTIYGAFLCRGDLTTNACQDCVSTASKKLLQECPKEKEALIWLAECMVRYSDQPFFSISAEEPVLSMINTANVSDQNNFMNLLSDTINKAADQAETGGADKKYGTKEANVSLFQTLYTLAQCTPDLSQFGCQKCLGIAITALPSCCSGKQGARVLIPSCNIRYELYPFYQQVSVPTPPEQPPTLNSKDKSGISTAVIIAIVAPIVVILLLTFFAFWIITTRARRKKYNSAPLTDESVQISSTEFLQFDFDTITRATNNFYVDNKLGEGGFGAVYKGTLPNGHEIAVKRLSRNSSQGVDEFKNEVFLVAKLQHRNLVRLFGFCLDGEEKMLIYEFVPNKSLDHFIFDLENQHQLNWRTRYKIIEGIARGMLYLHEDSRLRIIHRDLKASNVLLDENLNPKISDFGMARIFGGDQTQANTNRVVGTLGYMSPEYAMHGQVSVKVDVYSFGVLILEIISGKKITSFYESSDGGDLLNHAWKLLRDGKPLELLSMTLRDSSYSRAEVIRCIHIGLSCVQKEPTQRPTMQAIVLMLNSHSVTLAAPQQPAGYIHSKTRSRSYIKEPKSSSDKSTSQSVSVSVSVDDSSITDIYPR